MEFFVSDKSNASDLEDMTATAESPNNETSAKKAKYDPFAEFRNVDSKCSGHVSDFEADVDAEFQHSSSIISVDLQQPDAVRSVLIFCCGGDSRVLTFRFWVVWHDKY